MSFTPLQQKVINDRSGNMLVSASAGSGKTTVMIERVLALLSEGSSLARMVICTFTRAAASDMREKLQNALIRASEAGLEYADEQLKLLPSAEISTIHSWCQHLIRDYFYELGVDPAFEIADETEANVMLSEAIENAIESSLADNDTDFALLYEVTASRHGDDNLRKLVRKIHAFVTAQPDPDEFLRGYELSPEIRAYADEIVKTERAAVNKRFLAKTRVLLDKTASAGFVRNFEPLRTFAAMLEGEPVVPLTPRGTIADEHKDLADEFTQLKKDYKTASEKINAYDNAEWSDGKLENALVRLVKDVSELYAAAKRKKARLDYADLEHFACKLVSIPEVREEIKARYDYIFVDEYQDVNPLQERIISYVTGERNLFLVGDVKQSIYAFRMCDPRFFLDKYNRYSELGFLPPFELNDNFRSCKEILDFANEVFVPLMTEDFGKINYRTSAQLRCGSGKTGGEVDLNLIVKPTARTVKSKIYSVLEDVCNQREDGVETLTDVIVGDIYKKLSGYTDEKGNVVPPVPASDIAVLTRSRGESISLIYTKLKKLGVKVALSDEMKFTSVHEVAVLCEFMRALIDYTDDVALVAVLRSALVGVTDDDLSCIKLGGKRGEDRFYLHCEAYAREHDDELSRKLNEFYELRDRYFTMSRTHTAGEVVGALIAEKNWFLHVFSLPDAEIKAEVLHAFIEHLTSSPYGGSVYEYVCFLQSDNSEFKRPAASDALKIMTIHASKGLEFPEVYFINVDKKFNARDISELVVPDTELGVCMKRADLANRAFEPSKTSIAAAIKLRRSQREECMRLLYVALTRPKNGLHIYASVQSSDPLVTGEQPACVDYQGGDTFLDWLRPSFVNHGYNIYEDCPKIDYSKLSDRTFTGDADDKLVDELKAYFAQPEQKEERSVLKQSVTALMNEVEEETSVPYLTGGDDDRALRKGNAYHKAMELIDLAANFDGEWEKLKKIEDVSELVDREKLRKAASEIAKLTAGKRIYREQQFIYDKRKNDESTLVQGVIDLLIVDGENATIVDYKTSRAERIRSGAYNLQLSVYAAAVREVLGLNVVKTYIYAFETGELVDIETQKSL